jgi:hypothetical protein
MDRGEWKTYRLWFGQSIIRAIGHASTETIVEPEPTDRTFKARNQDEANCKVRKMMNEIGLTGTCRAVPLEGQRRGTL